jgi:hypothetical protein
MSALDKWLSRISLISQILLVGIALLTVKLTVIPLYQKELNSEELAKAQIKLSSVQSELDGLARSVSDKEVKLAEAVSRIDEISRAETVSRAKLAMVNSELESKVKDLSLLKMQNIKIASESAQLRASLASESQLKFRQALEWFTMSTGLSRDCYYPELSEIFVNPEKRIAETAKGCGPYAFLKNGLATLKKTRHDSSGDPLNIPDDILSKWFLLVEQEADREEDRLQSAFDLSIYKGLDPENLVQKENEADDKYLKRFSELEKARRDYSKNANLKDGDIAKKFIRNISLPI